MSAAWKKTSHERWNRVWFRSPLLFLFVRHYHYSFIVPVPLSLYPISPCPRESTRLRKTGTIWKQWNHMRVDSHWTFTHNARAYTVLLRMFTVRRWFDSARTSCMLAINNKKNGWKELIISGIIGCGTPYMTRTLAKLDNGLYAPDIYMSDETSEPTVDDSDREPCSLARHGIPAHCSCRLRMPTMTLSVARFVRQASVHSQSLNQN